MLCRAACPDGSCHDTGHFQLLLVCMPCATGILQEPWGVWLLFSWPQNRARFAAFPVHDQGCSQLSSVTAGDLSWWTSGQVLCLFSFPTIHCLPASPCVFLLILPFLRLELAFTATTRPPRALRFMIWHNSFTAWKGFWGVQPPCRTQRQASSFNFLFSWNLWAWTFHWGYHMKPGFWISTAVSFGMDLQHAYQLLKYPEWLQCKWARPLLDDIERCLFQGGQTLPHPVLSTISKCWVFQKYLLDMLDESVNPQMNEPVGPSFLSWTSVPTACSSLSSSSLALLSHLQLSFILSS